MQKKYTYGILALVVVFTFFFTSEMLKQGYPTGGDNVGHYDLLLNTIDALQLFFKTGELRFWNPDYYLGFPMFFFYAPLPYLTLALITLITGIEALTLFKGSIVLFFSMLPIIFYFCSRIMNFEEDFALGIALFSTALSSVTVFGLEYYSFFATGLYAQLWGIIFLPFAFACNYRYFVLGKGKAFLPVLFLYLTFISHLFAGIIAVILVSILALCCFVYGNRRSVFKKIITIFVFFAIATAFFTIPYLLNTDYFGNIPFDSSFKENGYGIGQTTAYLFDGELLDYSFSFSRLPLLTLFFAFGIGLSIFWKNFREKYPVLPLFLAVSLCFSIIMIAGKKSFGFLAYIPLLSSLQTFRFITLFHFIALLYIGICVYWIFTMIQTFSKEKKIICIVIFLLISAPVIYERMQTFKEYAYTYQFEQEPDYWNIIENIEKDNGRTYITAQTGLFEKPQHLTAIPFLTGTEIFASVGIGGHDSLNTYYTSFFLPLYLAKLFNVHTIIDKRDNELIAYFSQESFGYFELYTIPFSIEASPLHARESILTWLFTNASIEGYMIQLGEDSPIHITNIHDNSMISISESNEEFQHYLQGTINVRNMSPTVTILNNTPTTTSLFSYFQKYAAEHEPIDCGEILEESSTRGVYKATVSSEQEDCYAVFKMTYHPEWKAYVDDIEQEKIMVSPAFMAVKIHSGVHTVRFAYTVASYRILLFFIGIGSMVVLLWKK
jgi:hypothetical protein